MDIRQKLEILADAAKYDASCASSGSRRARNGTTGLGNTEGMGICHSYTPDGRCVSLLKILLTNHCIYDCRYCINRASSGTPRARFTPEEVAWLTIEFYKRNYIEGLFLSSGVVSSPDETMRLIVRSAKLLRNEHNFGGYIHLKAVPGASRELIEEAGLVADRVSANLELPQQADLDRFAPGKSHQQIEQVMSTLDNADREKNEKPAASNSMGAKVIKFRRPKLFLPAGQSTQVIVGATATVDKDYLLRSSDLYKNFRLRRVYYSAFSPIPDGDRDLPLLKAPLIREHRLYQADWLMRHYGFRADEIATLPEGNLDLEIDPKLAWALQNRTPFPLDVNKAPREMLLRVPGFGVRGVDRILQARRHASLRIEDLAKMGLSLKRARPFIVAAGGQGFERVDLDSAQLRARFVAPATQQLSLFSWESARTGEL